MRLATRSWPPPRRQPLPPPRRLQLRRIGAMRAGTRPLNLPPLPHLRQPLPLQRPPPGSRSPGRLPLRYLCLRHGLLCEVPACRCMAHTRAHISSRRGRPRRTLVPPGFRRRGSQTLAATRRSRASNMPHGRPVVVGTCVRSRRAARGLAAYSAQWIGGVLNTVHM